MKKAVWWTVGAVLMAEAILVWIVAGTVDVSATSPEGGLSRWFLTSVKDRSIRSRAADVRVPKLDDSLLVAQGFEHYNEMCVSCHGAPGEETGELAKGLNPPAPLLAHDANAWNAAQQFVIIKDGIKMTGMPAWGPTHSDSAVWAIVAFVRRLPSMTPEEYNSFKKLAVAENVGEHEHGEHEHRH